MKKVNPGEFSDRFLHQAEVIRRPFRCDAGDDIHQLTQQQGNFGVDHGQ